MLSLSMTLIKKKKIDAVPEAAYKKTTISTRFPISILQMHKLKKGKLSGPKKLPFPVAREIIELFDKDSKCIMSLKYVMRRHSADMNMYDIRVFNDKEALDNNIIVRDYYSLDKNPDLIMYTGWYDKSANVAHISE